MENLVVSACLLGVKCKYNGGDNFNPKVKEIADRSNVTLVCPEELAGLPVPRVPSEIMRNENGEVRVYSKDGEDLTEAFIKGAEKALKIAKESDAALAVMKQRSPSCGCGQIYDGSFTGKVIPGNGVAAELFMKNGIRVISEEDL